MSAKLGLTALNKLYLGTTELKKAYLGTTLIYDPVKPMPSFRAAGAGAGNNASLVAYPAGLVAGDALYLHLVVGGAEANEDTGAIANTPSGFTSVSSGASLVSGSTPIRVWRRSYIYKKIGGATGGESGSLGIGASEGFVQGARLYGFVGGADRSEGAGHDGDAASSTSIAQRSLTTSGANRLGLHFTYANANTSIGPFTGETGGDWTEAVAEYASSGVTLQLQIAELAAAGTISGGSASLGSAGTFRTRQAVAIYN